jgi:hypothetical protein
MLAGAIYRIGALAYNSVVPPSGSSSSVMNKPLLLSAPPTIITLNVYDPAARSCNVRSGLTLWKFDAAVSPTDKWENEKGTTVSTIVPLPIGNFSLLLTYFNPNRIGSSSCASVLGT